MSFPETLRAIRALCARYPQARTILVEDTANGPAAIETLMHEIPGIIAITPKGGKTERAAACAPRVEAGNVYLPRPTAPNGRRVPARAWVDDFIEQLAVFPKGAHDDDVDAFTQLLLRWRHQRVALGFPIGVGVQSLAVGECWRQRLGSLVSPDESPSHVEAVTPTADVGHDTSRQAPNGRRSDPGPMRGVVRRRSGGHRCGIVSNEVVERWSTATPGARPGRGRAAHRPERPPAAWMPPTDHASDDGALTGAPVSGSGHPGGTRPLSHGAARVCRGAARATWTSPRCTRTAPAGWSRRHRAQ